MRAVLSFALLVLLVLTAEAASGQSPTPSNEPTPSPSPTPGGSGSISGRIYADVNSNRQFDGWDVPAPNNIGLNGPVFRYASSSEDGLFTFESLPEGDYSLYPVIPIAQGCRGLFPYRWSGLPQKPIPCGQGPRFESATVHLETGQSVSDVSILGVPYPHVETSLWLDGRPAPTTEMAALAVNGRPCWPAQLEEVKTVAGISVTTATILVDSFDETACQGGELSITIGDRSSASVSWAEFWLARLNNYGVGGYSSEWNEVMIPPMAGIGGSVSEIRDAATGRQFVPDGTVVTSYAGLTVCAQARTKAVTHEARGAMNLFGLLIPSASYSGPCRDITRLSYCVDNRMAEGLPQFEWPEHPAFDPRPAATLGAELSIRLVATGDTCPVPIALPSTGGPG